MTEELINELRGDYRIKLYKHKVSKTTGVFKPYELILVINMAYRGEQPDYRTAYHDFLGSKKEAMDIIKTINTKTKTNPRVIIPVTKRTGKMGYYGIYDAKTDELLSSFFHKPVTDKVGIKAEAQRIADHFKTKVRVRRL